MLEFIDYKMYIWVIIIFMVVYGYGKYILDILKWRTKSHVYSWVVVLLLI